MSARPGDAPPEKSERDLAEDHELRIVRAKQRCRVVVYQGLNRFVAECHHFLNETEMVVYLTGSADQVRPCDITFRDLPT